MLVLPIDGSVDPGVRARLNANVQKLASNIDGKVTIGDTTFDETAAALGCDAEMQICADSVRATLGVDELVFGRATTTGTQTTLVVRRVRSKTAWREGQSTFSVDDAPEKSGTTVDTELSPLFDVTPPPPPPIVDTPPIAETPPRVDEPSNSVRTRGILLAMGGGVAAILGVVLWVNVSNTQDEIDAANPTDADDFRALEEKEDKAQRNAIIGDVLVVAGVALAAWGGWTIYQSRESAVTVTPTATPTSAGVSIGGRW
ncbi:MAG: hypothetical protein ACKV2T_43360 [Kofleriaceae bacterium]